MYINNTTKKPIKDISFEGYWFTVLPGVSLVWDKFGEFLTQKIYSIEGTGGGVPPVLTATAEQWDGKIYAEVRRFEINGNLIPKKADLYKIAKQRGVDAETIEQWKEDESIENTEIARAINELAVPDFVKWPEPEAAPAAPAQTSTDVADDLIKGNDAGANTPAPTPTTPPVPGTAKSGTAPKAKKVAAAKTPTTPKKGKGGKTAPAAAA